MPRTKGIGSRHKSGTGNNWCRQQTAPRDNRRFNHNKSHSKSNELSLSVIPVSPPLNDLVINPPQLPSVCQQSSRSSQNKTPDSQAYSIPVGTSDDPSNTIPPQSTNNRVHNVYICMVDVSKLTPSQRQQHAIVLLHHCHELCNKNDPSSIFVFPPPIPNIESFFQSTISSLGSGLFGGKISDVNIQQKNK